MNGSIRGWTWSAEGKHPLVKDFIRLGVISSLAASFERWIASGYRESILRGEAGGIKRCWRFWSAGASKESVSCGIVRDSSDSVGRPYPFLVLGQGPAGGWREHWGLLPAAFEETWRSLERLTAEPLQSLAQLEQALLRTRPPSLKWSALRDAAGPEPAGARPGPGHPLLAAASEVLDVPEGIDRSRVVFKLYGPDFPGSVALVSQQLSKRWQPVPRAVFLGGLRDYPRLVLFMRPLKGNDFIELWSDSQQGKEDVRP